jgi:hypothetical protein
MVAMSGAAKTERTSTTKHIFYQSTPIKVKVGGTSGIRDLLSVPEGILLLIGPDDDLIRSAIV